MPKRHTILAVLAIALAFCAPALADSGSWWREKAPGTALDQRSLGPDWAGRVKWDDGYLEVMAMGVADPAQAVNQAHAEVLALKTARYRAYERLLEIVKGVRLTSRTLVRKEVLADSRLLTLVTGMVRGARVISEKVSRRPDGSVVARVRVGMLLTGKSGLSGAALPWWRRNNRDKPPAFRPPAGEKVRPAEHPFTGLVVLAEGLGARPAMFPSLVEEKSGRVIYGPSMVDRDLAIERGMVGYATGTADAVAQKRTGDNPLIVKAVAAAGPGKARLVITTGDAVKIYAADLKSGLLRECRVTIVIK